MLVCHGASLKATTSISHLHCYLARSYDSLCCIICTAIVQAGAAAQEVMHAVGDKLTGAHWHSISHLGQQADRGTAVVSRVDRLKMRRRVCAFLAGRANV